VHEGTEQIIVVGIRHLILSNLKDVFVLVIPDYLVPATPCQWLILHLRELAPHCTFGPVSTSLRCEKIAILGTYICAQSRRSISITCRKYMCASKVASEYQSITKTRKSNNNRELKDLLRGEHTKNYLLRAGASPLKILFVYRLFRDQKSSIPHLRPVSSALGPAILC
jgi:hypothetical protein